MRSDKKQSEGISRGRYILGTLVTVIPLAFIIGFLYGWLVLQLEGKQLAFNTMGYLVAGLFLGILASFKNYKKFIAPLQIISDISANIKAKNFVYDINLSKAGGQMEIINNFASSMDELKHFVKNAAVENDSIEAAVYKINDSFSELNGSLKKISVTTEELSSGMQETAAFSEEMAATSQKMEQVVYTIAEKSEEGAQKAAEISSKAKVVMNKSEKNQQDTQLLFKETQNNLKHSIEKAKAVQKINELADSILQITSQTNMLALNAAIEAARAGEAGRGFSVVADEIRKLAEQSSSTINQIQNVADSIVSSVEELTDSSNHMLTFIEERILNDYEILVQTCTQYNEDANYYKEFSADLRQTSKEFLSSVQNLLQTIDGVANTASRGAGGAMEIAGSLSKVNTQSSAVLEESTKTKTSVEKLKSELIKFAV